MTTPSPPRNRWSGAWLDAGAFLLGLGLAWWQAWKTADLVWSLWLSSLVVGYAMIVWQLSGPLRELVGGMAMDRSGIGSAAAKSGAIVLYSLGTLLGLAFFTVHFGGFHFVHSVFLNVFFPVSGSPSREFVSWPVYAEVVARYWMFLPAAFLAERHAFAAPSRGEKPDVRVTPDAIARRKAKGDAMMAPYKNVIRMHLLIFFFAGAHFLRLDNFLVYAVVYAAYFFPWRLLRRSPVETRPSAHHSRLT